MGASYAAVVLTSVISRHSAIAGADQTLAEQTAWPADKSLKSVTHDQVDAKPAVTFPAEKQLLSSSIVFFSKIKLLSWTDLFAGIFFILPCIESYTKVDLRTVSFDVPPQEVSSFTR